MAGVKTGNRGPRVVPKAWYKKGTNERAVRVKYITNGKSTFKWFDGHGNILISEEMELR